MEKNHKDITPKGTDNILIKSCTCANTDNAMKSRGSG